MMDTKPRHMSTSSSSTNSSNSCLPNSTELPPVLCMRKDSTNTVGVASSIHSASTEDSKSSIYSTATSTASRTNDPIIQQRKVDPIAFGGSDALWDTIISNKTQNTTIEKMIRRGGSPNTAKQSSSNKMIKYGYGMLHAMIAIKASAFMNILLQQGANPNAMTLSQVEEDKVTPGYLAASMGWILGLQALVEAGADLTQAKGAGLKNKTALHVAVENCHTTVVEYIVSLTPPKYHAQVDSMGASALHYAALTGHTDLVNYLIQTCQLQTDLQDLRGETPLHWASRQGHLEVASLLIERCGCDFNAYVPRKIGTPYDLAKASGHKRLLDYYKKIGALTAKKMDRKREEEMEKQTPAHLEFALTKNGLFDF
ncbi:hypothetical protein CU098_000553 [Rhizopus stolonifer]|uniref:Uncharacterized protein n=1 Tax=Rhizopus stolonifer TaxID=4846 RepID=A0A367KCS9_RHIST|nr:hypothetical protein CU098_000553 [Rhizopus stolonifer]